MRMEIIGFIISLLVLVILLQWYHHHVILEYLKAYHCDPSLYNLIRTAKQGISRAESIRVEASIKNGAGGRYIVPVLLTEYQRYNTDIKNQILRSVNITPTQLQDFLNDKKVTTGSDIIFGCDKDKGKVYLDYGDTNKMELKCLESTGLVKRYTETLDAPPLKYSSSTVLQVVTGDIIVGHHYYLEKPQNIPESTSKDTVYWIARTIDGTITYYTRPKLPLITILDIYQLYIT